MYSLKHCHGEIPNKSCNVLRCSEAADRYRKYRKCINKSFAWFERNNLCLSLFFNKVEGGKSEKYLKKKLWHRFDKFLRAPILRNT